MAKKRRCSNCKDYFLIQTEYTPKYCSKECLNEARQASNQRALEKHKATQAKKLTAPKKPKKKREKSEKQKAKEAAWDTFSIYIRTRDCIRFTGKPDEGKCITCNRSYPFKRLQAGHFIQGRGNAVLFDERIVYSQCAGCNTNPPIGKGGNYVEYFIFMEKEWGREKIDEFRELKTKTITYKLSDFIELRQQFENKTQALLQSVL